jgi:hypothetical protein
MTAEDQFKNFRPELQKAFVKMIKGINVELTQECRDKTNLEGRWVFIRSIEDDESICLQDQYHNLCSNLSLEDIIL